MAYNQLLGYDPNNPRWRDIFKMPVKDILSIILGLILAIIGIYWFTH